MPISHKHKAIFVHIPKTAGTSIEEAMGIKVLKGVVLRSHKTTVIKGVKYAPQHFTCSILKTHPRTKDYWKKYFKFSFVRHPYTRVLSEFFWVKKKKCKIFNPKMFNEFLESYYMKLNTDHKLPQSDFLYVNGQLQVDWVCKFENLGKSYRRLSKKLKLPHKIPHIQRSNNRRAYSTLLTAQNKDFIYELYKQDFINFNYER